MPAPPAAQAAAKATEQQAAALEAALLQAQQAAKTVSDKAAVAAADASVQMDGAKVMCMRQQVTSLAACSTCMFVETPVDANEVNLCQMKVQSWPLHLFSGLC